MVLVVLVLFEILYMEDYIPLYFKYQIFFLPISVAFVWIFAISNGKISQILSNKLVFLIASISRYGFLIHHKVIVTVKYSFEIVGISYQN